MAAYSRAQEQKPPSIRPPPSELPTPDPTLGKGKVIGLDHFYNHQVKDDKQFHYVWDDHANSGFSLFGEVWKQYGATITKVEKAPTRADLDKLSIYMICNPSLEKNAAGGKPNYIQAADADVIEAWVKDGGVLLMFANDVNNSEFQHYTPLASRFGIKFNGDLRNQVPVAMKRARQPAFKVSETCSGCTAVQGCQGNLHERDFHPHARAPRQGDTDRRQGRSTAARTTSWPPPM